MPPPAPEFVEPPGFPWTLDEVTVSFMGANCVITGFDNAAAAGNGGGAPYCGDLNCDGNEDCDSCE